MLLLLLLLLVLSSYITYIPCHTIPYHSIFAMKAGDIFIFDI